MRDLDAELTGLDVAFSDIPPEGLQMRCEVSSEVLDLPPEDGTLPAGLLWTGNLTKTPQGVWVTGVLEGVIVRMCVRCLQEFEEQLSLPCRGFFTRLSDNKTPGQMRKRDQGDEIRRDPVGMDLDSDDEIYACSGPRIDVDRLLREQVILSTPVQPHCREDCLGLCPQCGENRNVRRCRCLGEPSGLSFAAVLRSSR